MTHPKKKAIGIGLTLAMLAVIAAIFLLRDRPGQHRDGAVPPNEPQSQAGSRGDGPGAVSVSSGTPGSGKIARPKRTPVHVHDIAQTALQLNGPELAPEEDLLIIQNLIDYYRRIHGANPEGGLNFEIVGKLTGENEKQLAMLTPDHPSLNADGELLDRWGTPYWFHPVSRDLMEIVSAGPDKQLWTEDDVRVE